MVRISRRLTALTLLSTIASSSALADCQAQLADVNARLASANLEGVALQQYSMIRDQAAMFCNQGQEAMAAQMLAALQQELPAGNTVGDTPGPMESTGRQELTDDYLAGTWCAMVTQEQAQITFSAEGTYSACFHDSMQGRYGHCSRPRDTSDWLGSFKQARVVGPDEFALGNSARSTRYKRGDCASHGL